MADEFRPGADPEDAMAVPDAATLAGETPPPAGTGSPAPQSQWTLILREFRRRRLAVVSAFAILVLVTLSVFAPFIANDRPLVYRGIDRFAYADALRTLRTILAVEAATAPSTATEDAGSSDAQRGSADSPRIARSLIGTMAGAAAPDDAAALRELGTRVEESLGQTPGAERSAQLTADRDELLRRFSVGAVSLPVLLHWPAPASLNRLDVAFMVLVLLLLTWPLWRKIVRGAVTAEPPSRRTAVQWGVLCGSPVVCAALWALLVPSRVDRADYYAGAAIADTRAATDAPVIYEWALWPPIPYGIDRYDLDALYAPPAFWDASDATKQTGGDPEEADRMAKKRVEESARAAAEDGLPLGGAAHRTHWLGTDSIGRDVLARMIWGGRISLAVGIVAVSIYVVIGILVGAIAGYFRGATDMLISRIIEIVIVFPSFFLILAIVAFLGPSIFNIMVVIGLTGWTGVARLVRGEFLRLGEQEFVIAGKALGYSAPRLIFRHVLPNAMAPVLVAATFGIAGAILTESALSFLGFGITVPQPSWGGILSAGRDAINRAPWLIYFPGFAIFITITAYNLVGEALRDAADPKLRGRLVR